MFDCRTYQQPEILESLGELGEFDKTRDMNGIPSEDRHAYVYFRGLSYLLLDWFFDAYIITPRGAQPLTDPWRDVFAEPLADIMAVLHYGAETLQDHHPEVPADEFQKQLALCFEKEKIIMQLFDDAQDSMSLLWAFHPSWIVSKNPDVNFKSIHMFLLYFVGLFVDSLLFRNTRRLH